MKQNLLSSATLALSLLAFAELALPSPAQAQSDPRNCTNARLFGLYGFSVQGTLAVPGKSVIDGAGLPFRAVVMRYFDGHGHLVQLDHGVVNGAPPPADWTPGNGTYTVNLDCTGVEVIHTPSSLSGILNIHFVVVHGGDEIDEVVDTDAVVGIGKKVQ